MGRDRARERKKATEWETEIHCYGLDLRSVAAMRNSVNLKPKEATNQNLSISISMDGGAATKIKELKRKIVYQMSERC